MKAIRKLLSTILYGITKGYSYLMAGLIYVLETGILLVKSFLKGCALIVSMGGCLVLFLLIGPIGHWLIQRPLALVILIMILIFPILGAISVTFLKYFERVSTQYLFQLSRYLSDPKNNVYHAFDYYKQAYRQAEQEAARREQARREQQHRTWEEQFRNWQYQGYRQQPQVENPFERFKEKYEKSCEILGIPVTTDPNKIKLAYRRKAKRYHPDLNKDPQATQQFQVISEAYEFLDEEHIRRYINITNQ